MSGPAANTLAANTLDEEFLAIVRCPVTHGKLRVEGDRLISQIGGLSYPIRDGIPVLLPEEAELPAGVKSLDDFRQKFEPAKA